METLNAVAKPSPLLRLCGRKLPIKPSYLLVLIIMILAAQSYFFWDTTVIATIRNCKDKQFFLSSEYLISIIKGIGKGEVAVLIALVAGMRGYGRLAVEILLALVISSLLVLPLKVAVHRKRPRGNSFVSFPSGDAATAAAVAEPIVSAAPGLLPVTAVVVVGIAMGRVLDDAHYLSDVLFGIALGIIAGLFSVHLCGKIRLYFRRHLFSVLTAIYLAGIFVLYAFGMSIGETARFLMLFGPGAGVWIASRYLCA